MFSFIQVVVKFLDHLEWGMHVPKLLGYAAFSVGLPLPGKLHSQIKHVSDMFEFPYN
jgi:hypothetical protein